MECICFLVCVQCQTAQVAKLSTLPYQIMPQTRAKAQAKGKAKAKSKAMGASEKGKQFKGRTADPIYTPTCQNQK